MSRPFRILSGLLVLAAMAWSFALAAETVSLQPPVAKLVPHELTLHGIVRTDNYYWLREKDNPETIAYLEAENAYADALLAPLKPLADELYEEMKSRLDDADVSVPYFYRGYWYETRYAEGADYPTIYRRKETREAPEEIVLDVTKLAEGHEQYNLNDWAVSPDGTLVAFAVDFSGGRRHTIFVRNIASGEMSAEQITDTSANVVWANDNKTLFYVKVDPVMVREYQLWRHTIGTPTAGDTMIYEEKDETFSVTIGRSKSMKYVLMLVTHLQQSEEWYLSADDPASELKLIEARKPGVQYYADHIGANFYVLTNLNAPDFRIVSAPEATPQAANWTDVVEQTPGRYIASFEVFDRFIAFDEEHDAVTTIRIRKLDGTGDIAVPMPAEIGVQSMGDYDDAVNLDPASATLRLGFSGPLTPDSIYDFNVDTGELTLLKQDPAINWFKPELYAVERIQAPAADGTNVPVTVVYRKDLKREGGNPTLLYGYGAYGVSEGPAFRPTWFSLVDRGFVFAVAHVRGGREMGRAWYDGGRMANKMNSFTDFIAAGEAMIAQGLTDRTRLYARGGSAGGLLMGAVTNLRPDLWSGIVAEVPFVDVITTMSDATIPLTTFEYEEWGNPAIKEQYDYMIAYSPYDRVEAKAYPPIYVSAGLEDSQVGYFEPAKWVARLRAMKTDQNPLLFRTNMGAGHSGDSGRLGFLVDRAQMMAWLLGRANPPAP